MSNLEQEQHPNGVNRKFTFNRGSWEDTNPLPDWQDGEDFDDFVTRIGFSTIANTFGYDEERGLIEIYESTTGKGSFYANATPFGSSVYEVFLPDFPSMMMFIKDFAAVFFAKSSSYLQYDILSILEKQFQAQHGHSAYDVCPKCDPHSWEILRARKGCRMKQETKK
ncbi:MAG: hypothetical protein FWG52_10230 [Proteobacteria bacterium]|nr:hypothetical protein [Pseudomonadota bacterium]